MIALGMGADVTVLDRSPDAMRALWKQFGAPLKTEFSTHDAVERHVSRADLVIGGVLIPGASAPKLVTAAMIRSMQRARWSSTSRSTRAAASKRRIRPRMPIRPTWSTASSTIASPTCRGCSAHVDVRAQQRDAALCIGVGEQGLETRADRRSVPARRAQRGARPSHVPTGRRSAGLQVRRPDGGHQPSAAGRHQGTRPLGGTARSDARGIWPQGRPKALAPGGTAAKHAGGTYKVKVESGRRPVAAARSPPAPSTPSPIRTTQSIPLRFQDPWRA